jgi:hypothetical protein
MTRIELSGRIKSLHRVEQHVRSPFVVCVELRWKQHPRRPWVPDLNRSYELEFFVEDEKAAGLRLDQPIRISITQS